MFLTFTLFLNRIKPERFFLTVSLIFGLAFIFLIPPFHNPDEPVHFFRVYQLSALNLFGENSKEGVLTSIPSSFIRGIQSNLAIDNQQINFHPDIKASPTRIIESLRYPLDESKKENTLFSSATSYLPTSYIPQIFVMIVDRLLGLSPVVMLYTLRLTGLGLYVALVYYALKILPYRKWTIALLALLPMSLAQAAAVTADSSLIAFLILFMAIILRSRENPAISTKLLTILAIATIFLGTSKQIFIFATPLILLVPSKVFLTKQAHKIYLSAILGVTLLVTIAWDLANPVLNSNLSSSAASADAHARILQTLEHPIHLVVVAYNTFLNQNSDVLYWMFAGNFGWVDTKVPLWSAGITIAVVLYSLTTDYEKKQTVNTKQFNLGIMAAALIIFAATCAIFYIYLTPIESRQIMGLQGRYFIPIVILLGFLQGNKIFRVSKKEYSKMILIVVPILLAASIVSIVGRFYWRGF